MKSKSDTKAQLFMIGLVLLLMFTVIACAIHKDYTNEKKLKDVKVGQIFEKKKLKEYDPFKDKEVEVVKVFDIKNNNFDVEYVQVQNIETKEFISMTKSDFIVFYKKRDNDAK